MVVQRRESKALCEAYISITILLPHTLDALGWSNFALTEFLGTDSVQLHTREAEIESAGETIRRATWEDIFQTQSRGKLWPKLDDGDMAHIPGQPTF